MASHPRSGLGHGNGAAVPRALTRYACRSFRGLDPAGVRIFRHLRQIYSELKWAVPDFWSEHIEERALSGAWPDDLDLDAAPTLIRELASRGLWLEQELIAVDPRLRAALEATGEG